MHFPARRPPTLPPARRLAGWAALLVGLPALTASLVAARSDTLAVDLLLYLGLVLVAGAVGGSGPGVIGALAAATTANYYVVPPVHRLTIAKATDVVALVVFTAVGVTVSTLVNRSARRAIEARRAQAESEALAAEAARIGAVEQADALRTAILRAVSHDLRTPLASIKAAVTSLLSDEVVWSPDAVSEFHHTIDDDTDRLNHLVGNLLDMSRLQVGALELQLEPVALDDVVGTALATLGPVADDVEVDMPDDVPLAYADAALLERVVANLLTNALEHTPSGRGVWVRVGGGERANLTVVDHGPGVAASDRAVMVEPFQRLGDRSRRDGVGLGLAVANGFVKAMGGTLTFDETPGGGLTAVVQLPRRPAPHVDLPDPSEP